MKRAVFYSDGASKGNPGRAGIGVYLEYGGDHFEVSEYIGIQTNNVAEYAALVRGLEEARRLKAEEVNAYLDSELLVKQIKGQYRVKNKGLLPYYERAVSLIRSFNKFSISHVPRDRNKKADQLSKAAASQTPDDKSQKSSLKSKTEQGNLPY
jgi:ribonuclease HI